MMSDSISFTNNGAGITWGNSNNSQIYDDSNLYISSVANILLYTPTQVTVTSPNTYFTGDMYSNSNNILASQAWVNNQCWKAYGKSYYLMDEQQLLYTSFNNYRGQ